MSKIYTYSEARRNLASLLETAVREGEIRVRRKDGQIFVIILVSTGRSPLDVEGIDLGLSKEEIVEFIHEGRKYSE
jgi:PAS domain-containing protein